MAHARFPKIDRSAIPHAMQDDPAREGIELSHYVISLYRCGALTAAEVEESQRASKNGYSDYRFAEDRYELVMVPNDAPVEAI